ncbi:hypothetical protein PIB30_086281, partial [Stylosanthes scabra]|nr:hypothetical protein [Stylosanthes scabra]
RGGLPARTRERCGFFTFELRRGQMRLLSPSMEPSRTVRKGQRGGDGGFLTDGCLGEELRK